MTTIFFYYSQKDEVLRNELEAHSALPKHEGLVEALYDRRIVAGDVVDDSKFSELEAADNLFKVGGLMKVFTHQFQK